jgi:hypothetical protein
MMEERFEDFESEDFDETGMDEFGDFDFEEDGASRSARNTQSERSFRQDQKSRMTALEQRSVKKYADTHVEERKKQAEDLHYQRYSQKQTMPVDKAAKVYIPSYKDNTHRDSAQLVSKILISTYFRLDANNKIILPYLYLS